MELLLNDYYLYFLYKNLIWIHAIVIWFLTTFPGLSTYTSNNDVKYSNSNYRILNVVAIWWNYSVNNYLPVAKNKHIWDLNNNGNINIQMFIMIPELTCFMVLIYCWPKVFKDLMHAQTNICKRYIFLHCCR